MNRATLAAIAIAIATGTASPAPTDAVAERAAVEFWLNHLTGTRLA